MKHALQPPPLHPEQPQGDSQTSLRLHDCGEVLTIEELCRALKIGRRTYTRLVQHRAFPIKPVKHLPVIRYAKVAVERYLAGAR